MSMSGGELKDTIVGLGLSQVEFARLLGVSIGAVAQWLSEARSIPGPVESYINLFLRLPATIQEMELKQIRSGNLKMNGMYTIEFEGSADAGLGTLTLKDGLVYGFDSGGGIYDGQYVPSDVPGMVSVTISVMMPAGQPSVIGGIVHPFDWTLVVSSEIPINSDSGRIQVRTSLGPSLTATYRRMRYLPMAA